MKSDFGLESRKDKSSRGSVREITFVILATFALLNGNVVGCPAGEQGQQHSTHIVMQSVAVVAAYGAVHMSEGMAGSCVFGGRHDQRGRVCRWLGDHARSAAAV